MAKKQTKVKAKEQTDAKKEGNVFDKILKEISETVFIPLICDRLGIKIKKYRVLRTKMQRTLEREMDFFYEIENENGEKRILHIEFETQPTDELLYRIGEYHSLDLRNRKMPIKHIVVYIGYKDINIKTELKPEEVYTGFTLLDMRSLNANTLLDSQDPNSVLLAILADFPKEKLAETLDSIINKFRELIPNPKELKQYFSRLIMLSRLRKAEDLTTKKVEEMPISYDITTDYLYNRGRVEGRVEGKVEGREESKVAFVSSLLINTDFDIQRIALIVGVDTDFVEKVKKELN